MTNNEPLTGRTFSNRYKLGERIGIGGMAEVYSAQDMVLGRIVAVKVMLPQYASDPEFTRRFRQEAAAAANLQSPYIVNVYDWGHDEDTYYIVMEFVRGSDLKTAIQERGPINQRKVAEIGVQVCQALSVAHQQDIIHRDVKPQNIMIQPDGNIKVMDFGIARAKNSTAEKTSTVLGTAHYTSPEQAQGQILTPASDIYSLGIVLYEASTGVLPFDGTDAVSVALMQVKDTPRRPRDINPNIDPAFEEIIMCAMNKNPDARFATANDMRTALNDFLAGRPINFAALVGAGAIGLGETAVISPDGFTSARTSVIQPIGAAGMGTPGVDTTQVMPLNTNMQRPGMGASRQYASNNQPKKSGKGKVAGIVIAIIAVLALAIAGGFALGLFDGGDRIDVPNVIGLTAEEAEKEISDAGFEVGRVQSIPDDTQEAGLVIDQDPSGGTKAAKGSTINLVVSQGTEQLSVPNLVRMTLDQARTQLSVDGFVLGNVGDEFSSDIPEGQIISQDPAANTKLAKGSPINVVLSKGVEEISVPSVTGMSSSDARTAIENAGLNYVSGDSVYSSSVPQGSVIRQNPSAGSKLKKGETVTCVISLGPEPTPDPPTPSNNTNTNTNESNTNAGNEGEGGETSVDNPPQ